MNPVVLPETLHVETVTTALLCAWVVTAGLHLAACFRLQDKRETTATTPRASNRDFLVACALPLAGLYAIAGVICLLVVATPLRDIMGFALPGFLPALAAVTIESVVTYTAQPHSREKVAL